MAGYVRARDLRDNIKSLGFETGVTVTLERVLEELASHRQYLKTLTELVDQCIELTGQLTFVGERMKEQLTELKRVRDQDGGDISTGDGR